MVELSTGPLYSSHNTCSTLTLKKSGQTAVRGALFPGEKPGDPDVFQGPAGHSPAGIIAPWGFQVTLLPASLEKNVVLPPVHAILFVQAEGPVHWSITSQKGGAAGEKGSDGYKREGIIHRLESLKGSQRKYLRGLAHELKPAAFVGQKGLTQALITEVNEALDAAELIKVKFVDFKEKKVKTGLSQDIAKQTGSHLAGLIGHVAIYYRQQKDPDKRKIMIP